MKRMVSSMLAAVALMLLVGVTGCAAPAQPNKVAEDGSFTYYNGRSGISFVVPQGWSVEVSVNYGVAEVEMTAPDEAGKIIYDFTALDNLAVLDEAWVRIPGLAATRLGMAWMRGVPLDKVEVSSYNGERYYSIDWNPEAEGLSWLFRVENGRLHQFHAEGDQVSADALETMLGTVRYHLPTFRASNMMTPYMILYRWGWLGTMDFEFVVSMVGMIAGYLLPMVFYCRFIRRKPHAPRTARWIAIIYGMLAFILVMLCIPLRPLRLTAMLMVVSCGMCNYCLLICGRNRREEEVQNG